MVAGQEALVHHHSILAALLLRIEFHEACGAVSGCGMSYYSEEGRYKAFTALWRRRAYGSLFDQIPSLDSLLSHALSSGQDVAHLWAEETALRGAL
jgi:hypothetical protein